jgi:phospholipid-translocating ATPase
MTRGTAEPKLTAADVMIDKLTIAIFLLQIVVVLVLGYFGNIWKDTQGLKVSILFYKQYLAQQIHFNFHACCTCVVPSHGHLLLYLVTQMIISIRN